MFQPLEIKQSFAKIASMIALGCFFATNASAMLTLGLVGPNPFDESDTSTNGQLEVYSALEARTEGDNPTWYQHADYYLYNESGHKLKHIFNEIGYYEEAPRIIILSPGQYFIEAPAKEALRVRVPIVIQAGRITEVHLDGLWRVPGGIAITNFVVTPGGYPVGWKANLAH